MKIGQYDYDDVEPVQKENGLYGFYTKDGKEIFPPQWDEADYFTEDGFAAVMKDELWGFIDHNGRLVLPYKWEEVSTFGEGRCAVKEPGGGWDFIDTNGRLLFSTPWKEVEHFSEGLCGVQDESGLWGFINTKGRLILPAKWHSVYAFLEGYAPVMDKNEKWGIINHNGKIVIPCQWKETYWPIDGIFTVYDDNDNEVLLDKSGNEVAGRPVESGTNGIQQRIVICLFFILLLLCLFAIKYIRDKDSETQPMPMKTNMKIVNGAFHINEKDSSYALYYGIMTSFKSIPEYQEEVSKELLGVDCKDIEQAVDSYVSQLPIDANIGYRDSGASVLYPHLEITVEKSNVYYPKLFVIMSAKKTYRTSPNDGILKYQKVFSLDLLNRQLLTVDNVFTPEVANGLKKAAGKRSIMVIPYLYEMNHYVDAVSVFFERERNVFGSPPDSMIFCKNVGAFTASFTSLVNAIRKKDSENIIDIPLPFDRTVAPKVAKRMPATTIVLFNKRTQKIYITDTAQTHPVSYEFNYSADGYDLLTPEAQKFIESQLN